MGTFPGFSDLGPGAVIAPRGTPKSGFGRTEFRREGKNIERGTAPLVVSCRVTVEGAQRDGRFWIAETHTYADGRADTFSSLVEAGTDANARMAARAAQINADVTRQNDDMARTAAVGP